MKPLLVLSVIFFLNHFTYAQQATVEGTLFEDNPQKNEIVFGKVKLVELDRTISTDFRGHYFFDGLKSNETYTLEFSFLGFKTLTKQIKIKEKKIHVDATLKTLTPEFIDKSSNVSLLH